MATQLTLPGPSQCHARWRPSYRIEILRSLLGIFILFLLHNTISCSSELRCPPSPIATTTSSNNNNNNNNNVNDTIAPSDMTPLDVNVTFLTSVSKNGTGKLIAGAFFVAINRLNAMAQQDGLPVNFSYGFYNIQQSEIRMVRTMVDVYERHHTTAFVGPDSFCQMAGLEATALAIPLFAFNCEDAHNKTDAYTMVNTDPSIAHAATGILDIFEEMRWQSFWLVSGTYLKWLYAARVLSQLAAERNIRINGETRSDINDRFSKYDKNERGYQDLVSETKDKTRIYVYLGDYDSMILFLRELHKQNVIQEGKHVVVAVDDSTLPVDTVNFFLQTWERLNASIRNNPDYRDMEAFGNTLLIQPHVNFSRIQDFESHVNIRNTMPPINLDPPPNFLLNKLGKDKRRQSLPKSAYHLYDATMLYGQTVMSLMAKRGADPKDASQIICHIRNTKNYTSIVGSPIEFLSNGESKSTYLVRAATIKEGRLQRDLKEVGDFRDNKFRLNEGIDWITGVRPKSEPKCGFQGELCSSKAMSAIYISLGVALPLIAAAFLFLGCKYCMYERKLERLAWKINLVDIERMNDSQFKALISPKSKKKVSIQTNNQLTELLSSADGETDSPPEAATAMEDTIEMGMYKGSRVAIKQLTRKHLELTRPLKKQLQFRKEMTHENINRFIGACFEPPQVFLVSLYCGLRSLKDVLEDKTSHLDDMFKTSLALDLIKGMSFIHDSDLQCHGNLKPSNCLIDSRWTLKLSDFGFSALGPPPRTISYDEKTFKKLLWTAPELLYRRFNSSSSSTSNSTSQHHSQHMPLNVNKVSNGGVGNLHITVNHRITQKGDVYSFAITLYELYGKSGPWGPTELTAKETIDRLLHSPLTPFRPDLSILNCDDDVKNLIESCWQESPEARPDFKHTISLKFKPLEQKYLESSIINNMLARMERYANNLEVTVAERTVELKEEQKMTKNLLLRMLPLSVAERLIKKQPVMPEQFECVTIYFSDIVGFTELSAESSPMEVVDFLNELYTCFDSIIGLFDVYKVETIGDAYMVVSGLPKPNEDRHAGEIASMSLMLLNDIQRKKFKVRHSVESSVKIRMGIHSGPCCAGVVGLKMPRYCLFGDTVNTANRMESTSETCKIHCSDSCKQILDKLGGYHLVERGYTSIKGKGEMLTHYLINENMERRQQRIATSNKANRCVSTSNPDYNGSFQLNRRGLPPPSQGSPKNISASSISLPQQSLQQPQQMRNSLPEKSIDPYSLNTSMDSAWTDLPEDPTAFTFSDKGSSTLPRTMSPRQSGGLNMSPIAEDPWAPVEPQAWSQNLSRNSQPVSERDSLLSSHALTSSGKFSSRRNSDNRPSRNSTGSSDGEERKRLMTPETIL